MALKGKSGGGKIDQHFDKTYGGDTAQNYQNYFVPVIGKPIAKDLIKIADIHPGENVLDVACGTGVAAFLAKEKAGNGLVAGVDINPGMLRVARSVNAEMSVDWYEAPAEKLPLSNNMFDVVLSNLSLQFFPDKDAALSEMYRVLKNGGRLVITLPGPTPVFEEADDIFERYLGSQAAGFVRTVFSLSDHDEIREMISMAGFDDVKVRSENKTLHLPEPKDFLIQYIASTPLAAFLEKLDDKSFNDMQNEIAERWEHFKKDGQLLMEHKTIITSASKLE